MKHIGHTARRVRFLPWRVLLVLVACAPVVLAAQAHARVRIVTSIPPLAMIAAEIGGDRVEARSLIAGSSTPHSYTPRPSDVAAAARADITVRIGGGIDDWVANMVEPAAGAVVVTMLEAGNLHGGDGHAHHGHAHDDPHVWLDPAWMRDRLVPAIVRALSQIEPAIAPQYEAQGRLVRERLTNLEDDIRQTLARSATRQFVAFHPAWEHFAARFGLHSVGAIEESAGEEPTLRSLVATMRAARAAGVRAILVEPQMDPRVARTLAAELGAAVLTVDPLGDLANVERDTYGDLMMYNASVFSHALGVREE